MKNYLRIMRIVQVCQRTTAELAEQTETNLIRSSDVVGVSLLSAVLAFRLVSFFFLVLLGVGRCRFRVFVFWRRSEAFQRFRPIRNLLLARVLLHLPKDREHLPGCVRVHYFVGPVVGSDHVWITVYFTFRGVHLPKAYKYL